VFGVDSSRNAEMDAFWRVEGGDYVCALIAEPAGKLCVAGLGDGTILGLNPRDGAVLFRHKAHVGSVLSLSLSADGSAFASSGQDAKAKLWSAGGSLLAELPGADSAWVEHIAWSPRGERISTAAGRRVRTFGKDGTLISQSDPLESSVTGLAWRADGTALSAICYGGVHIFPFKDGLNKRHLPFKGSLISLAWSPDAKVIACGSQDCSIHFWRLASGQDSQMTGYPFKPKQLAWDDESRLLATSGHADITVWDFRGKGPEGSQPLQLSAHKGLCTSLSFSHRKGMLASGSQDTSILIWQPRSRLNPVRVAFLETEVTALQWCDDDRLVLGADSSGRIVAWKV